MSVSVGLELQKTSKEIKNRIYKNKNKKLYFIQCRCSIVSKCHFSINQVIEFEL